jgi:hypothetical protein
MSAELGVAHHRQSKIGDLNVILIGDEDVELFDRLEHPAQPYMLTYVFQIPMHHALRVQIRHGVGGLVDLWSRIHTGTN